MQTPKLPMNKTTFFAILCISTLLTIVIPVSTYIQQADAVTAKGVNTSKYGHATRNIVCGDKLCSETTPEEKNQKAPMISTTSQIDELFEKMDAIHEKHQSQMKQMFKTMTAEQQSQMIQNMAQMLNKMESMDANQHMKMMESMMTQDQMQHMTQNSTVASNLARFDELDFEAFSKQNWKLFNEIHSQNVLVIWPDGGQTKGIDQHNKDIMAMFDYAPDTRVISHPIKFGSGQWTAATGIVEGTFTQPMALPDGSVIPPTGKSFKVTMSTIARWENGKIVEEHLFWDNAEILKQMGI